jgi:hypothetical protein
MLTSSGLEPLSILMSSFAEQDLHACFQTMIQPATWIITITQNTA